MLRSARIALALSLSLLASSALGGMVYDVDRTDDTAGATACTLAANDCSLRGAIIAANANPGADTVNVPAGMYTLSIMGVGEDAAATGDLDITDDLTVNGAGAATTIVDGGMLDRVFHSDPLGTGKAVTLSGLTIQHGATVLISFVLSDGGAVRNGASSSLGGNTGGTLTLLNCVVRDSTTPRGGGVVGNVGTLVLLHTTVPATAPGRSAAASGRTIPAPRRSPTRPSAAITPTSNPAAGSGSASSASRRIPS